MQQRFESLCGQIELCYPVRTEQVYLPVFVSGDTQHCIAEQTVRIVFIKFETFDIVTVITVQPFARTYPYNAPFVNVQAVDGKLGKSVICGQMAESNILS